MRRNNMVENPCKAEFVLFVLSYEHGLSSETPVVEEAYVLFNVQSGIATTTVHSCDTEKHRPRASAKLEDELCSLFLLGLEDTAISKLIRESKSIEEHDKLICDGSFIQNLRRRRGFVNYFYKKDHVDTQFRFDREVRFGYETNEGKWIDPTNGVGPNAYCRAIKGFQCESGDASNFGLIDHNGKPISLGRKIFLLVLMNDEMAERTRKSHIVFMDETHCISTVDKVKCAELMGLRNVKGKRKGAPLAFIISNDWSSDTYSAAFKIIKRVVEDPRNGAPTGYKWSPKGIMSDMADEGPKALQELVVEDKGADVVDKQLQCDQQVPWVWCTWHVGKAVGKAVREKITRLSQEKRKALSSYVMSNFLRCMMATSPENLNGTWQELRQSLTVLEQTAVIAYLDIKWLERKRWALVFRKDEVFKDDRGNIIRTNMIVEAFHRTIKWVIMQGKRNRRVAVFAFDVLVELLKMQDFQELREMKNVRLPPARHRVLGEFLAQDPNQAGASEESNHAPLDDRHWYEALENDFLDEESLDALVAKLTESPYEESLDASVTKITESPDEERLDASVTKIMGQPAPKTAEEFQRLKEAQRAARKNLSEKEVLKQQLEAISKLPAEAETLQAELTTRLEKWQEHSILSSYNIEVAQTIASKWLSSWVNFMDELRQLDQQSKLLFPPGQLPPGQLQAFEPSSDNQSKKLVKQPRLKNKKPSKKPSKDSSRTDSPLPFERVATKNESRLAHSRKRLQDAKDGKFDGRMLKPRFREANAALEKVVRGIPPPSAS